MDVLDENIEAIIEAKASEQEAMELVCDEKVKQIESYNSKIKEARSALETIEELERKTDEKLLEDENYFLSSADLIAFLMILPLNVLGSSSTNSTTLGYL